MSARLHNKVALVTGAASGFGASIAERFAQEGAQVLIADLNAEQAAAVADRIGARALRCDVSLAADVASTVAMALQAFGRLDIVVNNAGTTHPNKPAGEVTEAEFDRLYRVNVKSLFHMNQHATPVFRAQGGGAFINLASTAGVRPRPGLTWYNGSKGAVITTSKSLAAELGPDNIRVNCVNPVFNPETGLSAEFAGGPLTDDRLAKFRATIPLGRFSTALDVANAVLYLASDDAAFISGVCIEVDGGRCV